MQTMEERMVRMKKRSVVAAAILLVICVAAVWWFAPKHFLRGVAPEEVSKIQVLDGNTGNQFEITDPEEIEALLREFQQTPMKKERISMGMGTSFRMTWLDQKGREIDFFILQTADTIVDGVVFYHCDGGLAHAEARLEALEEELCPKQ